VRHLFLQGAATPKIYTHLTTQDRTVVMTMRDDLCSIPSITERLCRSPSTISRELKRTTGRISYDAGNPHRQSEARRVLPGCIPKLHPDSNLFLIVRLYLKLLWSPQKISMILKYMWPDDSRYPVSHETIYNALCLYPRGDPPCRRQAA